MRGLLRMCPWACYDRPAAATHLGLLARLARQAAGFELHAGRELLGDAAYSSRYLRGLLERGSDLSLRTEHEGAGRSRERDYGPPRLIVELTNICNLHCSYCLRDEDALYHSKANFFPVELLRRVVREARESIGARTVMFTGGETTLHPRFGDVIEAVGAEGFTCSFVTNGWHFERVWPVIAANRAAVTHVSFSIDGPSRETHDRWRGEGSFVRLVRAFARCKAAGLPFIVKLGLRRDTLPLLEQTALFAARMGAASLSFGHNLPTSGAADDELSLGPEDRIAAEQEIAVLASILKMRVTLEVGYDNTRPRAALLGAGRRRAATWTTADDCRSAATSQATAARTATATSSPT